MPESMALMAPAGHSSTGGHHDLTTMVACLAIAGLGGLLALAARAKWRAAKMPCPVASLAHPWVIPADAVRPRARAGPLASVVLRL